MTKAQNKVKIRWSPNFAYAIGLIASDGNLSPDGRHINLKSADLELVQSLKRALNLINKISHTKSRNLNKHFYIQFGDVIFYKFLNQIGLYPAKSKTIKKIEIPNKFFADFLRGLFDGDGTFYSFWDKRWISSFVYQIAFSSASPHFVHWLKNRLDDLYEVRGFIKEGDGVLNLTHFKKDTRKLFSVMYHGDINKLLFLKRKYTKIRRALDKDAG